jgi:hypothetical protein
MRPLKGKAEHECERPDEQKKRQQLDSATQSLGFTDHYGSILSAIRTLSVSAQTGMEVQKLQDQPASAR